MMPHAWKAGPQTRILKAKLDAVPDGGVIVMIAPPNRFRCPPGPYERVSMMAHMLKAAGKSKCKIIVLEPAQQVLQAGAVHRGLGEALSGHGGMAAAVHPRLDQVG